MRERASKRWRRRDCRAMAEEHLHKEERAFKGLNIDNLGRRQGRGLGVAVRSLWWVTVETGRGRRAGIRAGRERKRARARERKTGNWQTIEVWENKCKKQSTGEEIIGSTQTTARVRTHTHTHTHTHTR